MTHLLGTKRKFNGKYYNAMAVSKKKSKMEHEAKMMRKLGIKARVIKTKDPKKGTEYYLYLRK